LYEQASSILAVNLAVYVYANYQVLKGHKHKCVISNTAALITVQSDRYPPTRLHGVITHQIRHQSWQLWTPK